MLICICRQHKGCIVQSQGRKRNLVHIKNFIQSFMQLDLSSKYDAFVCYFRANQQHLAFNNQMRNKKKNHSATWGSYVGVGFTTGQILKPSLTYLTSCPVGLVINNVLFKFSLSKHAFLAFDSPQQGIFSEVRPAFG